MASCPAATALREAAVERIRAWSEKMDMYTRRAQGNVVKPNEFDRLADEIAALPVPDCEAADAAKQHWEKLWEEQVDRAEQAEARVAALERGLIEAVAGLRLIESGEKVIFPSEESRERYRRGVERLAALAAPGEAGR